MAATVSTRLWIGVKCCATNKVRTRPVTWIYVDGRGRDLQTLVTDIQAVIAREVKLPPGVSVSYTGQFEFLVRATERMKIVVPVTLAIIFGLLYLTFRRFDEALLIMGRSEGCRVGKECVSPCRSRWSR